LTGVTETGLTTLLDGGRYFEGPRWHDGRLWFVDCMARTLQSVNLSGERREHATFDDTPCGTGILPDGRIVVLTMNKKQLFAFADGQLSLHADLTRVATGTIDDMIVDGQGRAYVGDLGFHMPPPPDRGAVGRILLVRPDGNARVVAEGLRFPNGIAVSADHKRLVVAEMDGACLADYDIEADGALRLRGRRNGDELQRIAVPGRRALACALGGPDRKTLFCLSAATSYEELRQRKSSSRIDVVAVETEGSGFP
jgi:sugar lactone lactonase YvrE